MPTKAIKGTKTRPLKNACFPRFRLSFVSCFIRSSWGGRMGKPRAVPVRLPCKTRGHCACDFRQYRKFLLYEVSLQHYNIIHCTFPYFASEFAVLHPSSQILFVYLHHLLPFSWFSWPLLLFTCQQNMKLHHPWTDGIHCIPPQCQICQVANATSGFWK